MAIVLNSYNPSSGCLDFTMSGEIQSSLFVQISIDNFTTFTEDNGSFISPRCGYFVNQTSQFRMRHPGGTLSNIIEYIVPILTITPIESESDISFCNSPIHIRLQNTATDASIKNAYLKLYIWNGSQNQSLTIPNHVMYAEKVSTNDSYINFEISEFIKAFLINPNTAPNTNQPQFAYNELTPPAITGQGVFWQVEAIVESTSIVEQFNFRTSFCTLGYRYEDEKVFTASLPAVDLWYNPKIHDYFNQSFNYTQPLVSATSNNVINYTPFVPSAQWERDTLDPYLIVFLNKLGLWQTFTPDGKVIITEKNKKTTNNIRYRDPSRIDTSYMHHKLTDNFDVDTEIIINTGSLVHEMVETVRQLVLSPKIYLIAFDGTRNATTTLGITIDNTFITIDSTLTTIDGFSVTSEHLGMFKGYKQIPVILTDTDFLIKTRLNDKNKIDYTMKFEKTTNAILDLR